MLRLIVTVLISVSLSSTVIAEDLFSGIDPDGFDHTVRPQDDLYQHVNGRWLLSTQIPADKSNYGSFTALIDTARENIRDIIESAAENPVDENSRKVGDFYQSFMNETLIAERGLKPLRKELQTIADLSNIRDLFRHLGYLQTIGVDGPVGFYVSTDAKDSDQYLAAVVQSGTTLPDRDYYLKDEEKYVQARVALVSYIKTLFTLAELPLADDAAEQVLQLETKLAEAQWTRTQLRDAEKRYNKFDVGELRQSVARLPWSAFFEAAGVPQLTEVNVNTPSYFVGLSQLGTELDLSVAKTYLTFRLLDSAAPLLPEPFVDAHFELHRKQLAGVPEQQPRWQRGVDATGGGRAGDFGVLGEVVGQLYVAKHFKPEAKQQMDQLVGNLMQAYENSIDGLSWMTDETKVKALEKLHKITPKVGYPVKWRDYSTLVIDPNDLLGNMKRSALFEHQRMIDKLGKPVDRTEWGMTPQTVNAYYNPSKNEIVFPAAILQPPFFNADADAAVNYGGIGAVIGHEISHGFDDQGSKYDGDGNLQNWWTDADREAFEALAEKLVAQYAGYEALPGKNLNGKLTLGENIADLSGMAIAYKAYLLSLDGNEAPMIDGHTGPQRFFLGWAQIWRRLYREEELVRRLVIDPHSPSHFRGNGPVTNLNAFYEAFDVQPGDKLYKKPQDRIQIW